MTEEPREVTGPAPRNDGGAAPEHAIDRLGVLAAAAQALSGSLDLGVLERLARVLVPSIADICAIDLFERDGSTVRAAAVHADPAFEGLVVELGRYLPSLATHPTVASALLSGASVLAHDVDEELLLAHVRDPQEAELLRSLGIRSGVVVPLRGHARAMGVLTLAQTRSGRRFDEADLAIVEDIARQAALAAENAMLFRDVERTSDRYRAVVEGADAIVWEAETEPFRHVFVSERSATLLGYAPEAWLDEGFFEGIVHDDDRSWVIDRIRGAAKLGEDQDLEYRVIASDGRLVWLHDRVFVDGDNEKPARLYGVAVDVTERTNAEMRQRAQLETTKILAEAESPHEIPARVLHALLTTLGWECGALWEIRNGVLHCVEFDQAPGIHVPAFEAATWRAVFQRGKGLPGRVLAAARPAWIKDVTRDPNFPRAPAAFDAGLRGAFAFPIMTEGRVQGVLEFFSREAREPDAGLLDLVGTIGVQMGQFIRRRQLEADLKASQTRLRAVVDNELDGVVTMDHRGIVTDVNLAATAMFGYDPEQMVGQPLAELIVPPHLRARHRAGLERYLRTNRATLIGTRVETTAMRADGSEFPVELSIGEHSEESERFFTGIIRDMTETRSAERRRDALHAITRTLADARSLAEGARRIIETICLTLDWEIGLMWEVEQADGTMRCITSWRRDQREGTAFIEESERTIVERGTGLIGRVWATERPLWVPDVSLEPDFVRSQAAAAEGYRSVFALPVIWAGSVRGVLEFYSHRIREPDEDLQRMMAGIGVQIGGFMERERSAEESAFRRTLLAAQSEATIDGLLILSPDGETLLRNQRFVDMFDVPPEVAANGSDQDVLLAVLSTLHDPEASLERIRYLYEHPDVIDRDELQLNDGRVFDRFTAPVVDDEGTLHGRIWSFRDVTEQKRTEQALQEINARTTFLAEVSRALVGSLDPRQMLEDLGRMAVPAMADWCAIDLVRADGTLDRVALIHRDPARIRWADEIRRRGVGVELDRQAPRGVSHVVLTGRSELEPDIPDAWLVEGSGGDPELLEAARALGLRSYICVPLIARAKTLGAMTWITSESGRRYKTADLWLAEDVARRAAMALDNVSLYAESAQVASTLQQSLIPPDLPSIPGVQVAARFRPSGLDVGGDFYDLFATGRGDWAVVVGDVCGKGAEAAAVTALARYTIRAAAMEARSPRSILRRLNEALLRQRDDERFCTVGYARLRGRSDGGFRLTTSSAGHPLPLIVRRDGTVERAGRPGMLLGMFGEVQLSEDSVELEPGDAVVMFTDGVTEAGRGSEMLEEEGVIEALSGGADASAEQLAEALDRAALSRTDGRQHDDIAIVVVRIEPG